MSQPQRNTAKMRVATITTTVVFNTSWRPGQVTFFISVVVSRQNSLTLPTHSLGFATSPFSSAMYSPGGIDKGQGPAQPFRAPCACGYRPLTAGDGVGLAGQEGLEPPTCG